MRPIPLSAEENAYRRSRTRPIGVRFDESTLSRLKILAARRHKGYQSLLKEFIVERLYEEEKREGRMALTIEPKLIGPDFGAVQIEDTIVVTSNGASILSTVPRELFEVRLT